MANPSSQSADWERTNTRAQNAWRKQTKANPKEWVTTNAKTGAGYPASNKAGIASSEAARAKMTESRNKIASIRNDAKKAAISKAAKLNKPAPGSPNFDKYKSGNFNGFKGAD